MKDRLLTLVGAIASLAVVTALLFPQEPVPPSVSRPTSEDRGELGMHGLARWLELNGVPTLSLRRRYSELNLQSGIPASGNLLISSLPHSYATDSLEIEALRAWIDQGNRILILAAVNDLPDWARLSPNLGARLEDDSLLDALGFGLHKSDESEDKADTQTEEAREATLRESFLSGIDQARDALEGLGRTEVHLGPAAANPLLAGVDEVATRAIKRTAKDHWRLTGASGPRLTRALLTEPTSGNEALWAVRYGNVTSWISSYPDLFGNRTLGEADNAELLRNLLSTALGPGGTVIFDDLHQGLSDIYDPQAFFSDERLWSSLGFVLVFWLLYVVGYSNRLAPPVKPGAEARASGLVEAMAGLFARRLPAAVVGRGLLHHFFNEVRARHKLKTTGQPCWEILAADPGVRREDLHSLQHMAHALEAGRKPDLRRLGNLLHGIRETLG